MSKETVLQTMHLAHKPLKAGEISELSGLDKTTVDKILKELKTQDLIVSPKRCYWQPK